MKPEKITAIATWIGLAGFGFFSPASIALSQSFFGLAVAGFIAHLFTKEKKQDLVFPPVAIIGAMAAYTGYRLLSMIVVGSDVLMIKEDWLFLMVIIGGVMFRDMKNLTRVLDIFAAGAFIMGSYGIWQHFVGVDLYHRVLLDKMVFGYRTIGNFSTYLTFSGFFAVASIFLVPAAFAATSKIRRLYYLVTSQIGLACILFNYSRSTIIALVFGIIVLVLLISARYRKWVSLALLVTLTIGIVISPDSLNRFKNIGKTEFTMNRANARLAIWNTTLSMIKEDPVFGIGPGNFHEKYKFYRENRTGKDLSHAHNDILNVAAESGVPCSLLYLILWFLVLLYLYKGYVRCPEGFQKGLLLGAFLASVVFFIMSQFEAYFADEEVRMLLMFFWGIGFAVLGNMKASERLSEFA